MATTNPFDLLGDDDNDDPSQLIAAQQQKVAPAPMKAPAPLAQSGGAAAATKPTGKLPSKPLPPAQSVREARNETQRGGGRGGNRGFGRGRVGDGVNRDYVNNERTFPSNNGYSGGYKPSEDGDAGKSSERWGYGGPRGGFRGGRRGGFSNGEVTEGERTRRPFERRSGTGRGNEIKRDGSGSGNWGIPADEIALETKELATESVKIEEAEKQSAQEDAVDTTNKESPVNEPEEKQPEEKEPENKEMTLEEYEKVLEEKRKALLALKTEERKVSLDKDFESMQQLSNKKSDDDVFVKLGSDKDKRKDAAEKEERAKKSVSINEFLKPAEKERLNDAGVRGRGGRGRGPREGFSGGGSRSYNVAAPAIDDVGQFPSLGAK